MEPMPVAVGERGRVGLGAMERSCSAGKAGESGAVGPRQGSRFYGAQHGLASGADSDGRVKTRRLPGGVLTSCPGPRCPPLV